jgi:hypothetical protein
MRFFIGKFLSLDEKKKFVQCIQRILVKKKVPRLLDFEIFFSEIIRFGQ